MSDLPQQGTIIQYVADGIENEYVFPYYVPEEEDIEVYVTLAGETPIPESDIKVLNVDYSVSFNIDPITGGFITFLSGKIPASGATVTLNRNVQASLNVEFANAQNFSGANLDAALDRLLLLIQQNKTYALQRNISYRVNSYLPEIEPNTQVQPLEPGYIWQGSVGGGVVAVELVEGEDVSTLRSELANDSPVTNGAGLVGYYNTVNSVPTTVKAFLDNIVTFMQAELTLLLFKPGMMIEFGGDSIPSGFLPCNGDAVSRSTYAALFAAIGTTWGSGDGSTTFNVPDSRRRSSVGSGGTGTAILGNTVGSTGGSESHTLTNANLPDPIGTPLAANVQPSEAPGAISVIRSINTAGSGVIKNNVSGQSISNYAPSNVVTKIIKY